MSDGETTKGRHTRFDEVGRWVGGGGQLCDGSAEHLPCTGAERNEQAISGAEEAVDGSRRRPDILCHSTNGQSFQAAGRHPPLRRFQECRGRALIVFLRPAHLDSVVQRCYGTAYRYAPSDTPTRRKRKPQIGRASCRERV